MRPLKRSLVDEQQRKAISCRLQRYIDGDYGPIMVKMGLDRYFEYLCDHCGTEDMSTLERKASVRANPSLYSSATSFDRFQENLLKGQTALRRYALSLTADLTEAEDLVQETTLRALKNRSKFVENVNFNGWLVTIMRNIFLNHYERKSRHRELIDRNVDVYNVSMPAEGSYYTPDAAFNLAEIKDEIDKLGDIARIPFKMYLKGYKYAEIAEELDLPVGTVKSRIFFARKELQKNLIDLKY